MRKFVLTVMASLFSCSAAYAFWPEAADASLEIGAGYRQDRLEWKTRNRCHSSDRCSESSGISYHSCFSSDETLNNGDDVQGRPLSGRSKVKWRNLNIWEIEGRGKYVTCDNIYLRANGDYGWITSGKNHDSDHREFGRRGERDGADEGFDYNSGSDFEFARSHSRARGHVYDARLAVGYEFRLCDCSLALVPLVGYSWHGQHIRDRHLKQRCFDENFDQDQDFVFADGRSGGGSSDESGSSCTNNYESFFGSSSGSGRDNSRYHTRWDGPFIGFDFDYRFWCDWTLFGTYEFHWAEYHARGHWFFRNDLPDGFRHRAKNAYGNIFDIGIRMDFCDCWTVAVKGEFQWWYADHGRDRARCFNEKNCDIKTHCFLSTPLRRVRWDSAAVIVDVGTVF